MGHTSAAMTALYTGVIPLEQIQAEIFPKADYQIVVLESAADSNCWKEWSGL